MACLALISLVCLAGRSAEAEQESSSAHLAAGTGSFILQQIKSYFEPAMDPKPQAALTNWEPEDRLRKQRLLRDAVDKTTGKYGRTA